MASASAANSHPPRAALSLKERGAVAAAFASAVAIFLTLGWMTFAPLDPRGPVSLVELGGRGPLLVISSILLAAVAAGLAAGLAGRRLPDAGVVAVGLGLAATTLRGGTTGDLLVDYTGGAGAPQRVLALKFAAESLLWCLPPIAALLSATWVLNWLYDKPAAAESAHPGDPQSVRPALADVRLPRWQRLLPASSEAKTPLAIGLKHTLIVAGVAFAVAAFVFAGLSLRAVSHNQALFLVFASMAAGIWAAQRLAPVDCSLWALLAVPIFTLAGYLWSAVLPGSVSAPIQIPHSTFMRVLPAQAISMGVTAAIVVFWYVQPPASRASSEASRPSRPTSGTRRSGRKVRR